MPNAIEYQRRKAAGICTACGARRPEPGRVNCSSCLARYHSEPQKAFNKRYSKQYALLHPDGRTALRQAIRARQNGNSGWFTAQEWINLKKQYHFTCLGCGQQEPDIKLTPDHVVPLSKGGSGYISNIQPLCMSCNSRKGANTVDYRRGADGR